MVEVGQDECFVVNYLEMWFFSIICFLNIFQSSGEVGVIIVYVVCSVEVVVVGRVSYGVFDSRYYLFVYFYFYWYIYHSVFLYEVYSSIIVGQVVYINGE